MSAQSESLNEAQEWMDAAENCASYMIDGGLRLSPTECAAMSAAYALVATAHALTRIADALERAHGPQPEVSRE